MTFHMPAFLPDHRFAEWCCTVVVSLTAILISDYFLTRFGDPVITWILG